MRPMSRRIDAAMAVLVAVNVAPTKIAMVNCVPPGPQFAVGTSRSAGRNRPAKGSAPTPTLVADPRPREHHAILREDSDFDHGEIRPIASPGFYVPRLR